MTATDHPLGTLLLGGFRLPTPERLVHRQGLILVVRLPREGEAPAEPHPPDSASPGSRLSRSFALPGEPGSTPISRFDKALDRFTIAYAPQW